MIPRYNLHRVRVPPIVIQLGGNHHGPRNLINLEVFVSPFSYVVRDLGISSHVHVRGPHLDNRRPDFRVFSHRLDVALLHENRVIVVNVPDGDVD